MIKRKEISKIKFKLGDHNFSFQFKEENLCILSAKKFKNLKFKNLKPCTLIQ